MIRRESPRKPAKKALKNAVRPGSPPGKAASEAKAPAGAGGGSASERIDRRIGELGDWRGKVLARARRLITKADPGIIEEWKWETPVWSRDGIVCTGETYTSVVKLTFARGASLDDPAGLFNSSLEGNVRRAIDIHEDDEIDETALADLVREAVALNLEQPPRRARQRSRASSSGPGRRGRAGRPPAPLHS